MYERALWKDEVAHLFIQRAVWKDEVVVFWTNGTYSGRMGTVALPQPCSLTLVSHFNSHFNSHPCPLPFSLPYAQNPHRLGRTVHILDEWARWALPNPSSLTLSLTLKPHHFWTNGTYSGRMGT